MLKFIKHIALIVLYFIVYQLGAVFLMAGLGSQSISDVPANLVENVVVVMSVLGVIILAIFSVLLWKFVYSRKTIEYGVESRWFHKLYWPILLYFAFLLVQFLLPIPESNNQKIVVEFILSYPIWAFFSVVVFAPILEELIFRGILANYFFPKMTTMKGVCLFLAVSGTLFSLVHGPTTLPQFLIYFVMGLDLGWFYLIKRDLRYPIVVHAINNLLSFALLLMSLN